MDDDTLTKEMFLKSFENVVSLILKMQAKNDDTISNLEKTYELLKERVQNDYHSKVSLSVKEIKDLVKAQVDRIVAEHEKKMMSVDEKMAQVHSGIDGKNADETQVVQDVLAQIKLPAYKETVLDGPDEIRNKLELLQGEERLDKSAIKGLEDEIRNLKDMIVNVGTNRGNSSGPNANAVQYADLSSQCNGVLKAFSVPRHRKIIALHGSESPLIYRPTTDFTTSNVTLTLTSEVLAPATGQSLIFLYIK